MFQSWQWDRQIAVNKMLNGLSVSYAQTNSRHHLKNTFPLFTVIASLLI